MVLRLRQRTQWHWRGILLWLIQRPHLRFLAPPLPSVTTVEAWEQQMVDMVNRQAWPMSWFATVGRRGEITAAHLKEAAHLRDRMGLLMAFQEDEAIVFGLIALKKKPRRQIQAAAAAETQRLLGLSREERTLQLRALIGPRGGLPQLKEELQKAAVLLQANAPPDAKVEDLRQLLRPIVRDLIGKPNWQAPEAPRSTSQAAGVKPKANKLTAAPTSQVVDLASPEADKVLYGLQQHQLRHHRLQEPRADHQAWDTHSQQPDSPMSETSFFPSTNGGRSLEGDSEGARSRRSGDLSSGWDGGRGEAGVQRSAVRQSIGTLAKGTFDKLKNGLRQTVHQGFLRLRRLHDALSVDFNKVEEALEESEYDLKMAIANGEDQCFLGQLNLPEVPDFDHDVLAAALNYMRRGPFLGETFTDSEHVKKQAELKGHTTMPSMTLRTGYDFMKDKHQDLAFLAVEENDPYAQIIAFPCGPWSPLQALRSKDRHRAALLRWRRKKRKKLVDFAVRLANKQMERGHHFIIENPSRSAAWFEVPSLKKLSEQPFLFSVELDQCKFGLTGPGGGLHRKRTWILTSSEEVYKELQDCHCTGDHEHEHVIGGSTARLAGRYPPDLAKAFIRGLERQYEVDGNRQFEVFFGENGDEPSGEADPMPVEPYEDDFDLMDDLGEAVEQANEPTKAQKQAVLRLHQNTGHRSPLRLAKALAISGASPELIKAAKNLQCEICHEQRRPNVPRPASLSKPRQFGDQVHVDLVAVKDRAQETFWIMHGIDAISGYQVAHVLETKSAAEVARWFNVFWIPVLGSPRCVVADCGPEFTSAELQSTLAFHDVLLHHVPVESPWANGLAERAGGSLKVILGKLIHDHSCLGRTDVQEALAAAVSACNEDIGTSGYSPAQFVLGKQPRVTGEVIPNDLRLRLTTHSLIENHPSLARQIALKETARVALVKLKYSAALRKAEFARARRAVPWTTFQLGDIVYFFRQQKVAPGGAARGTKRKKLILNQWHGPSMVAALEGGRVPVAAYIAYRGNLTKCAIEHIRPASTLERLAMGEWEELLQEVISASTPGASASGDRDDHPDEEDDDNDYEPTEPDRPEPEESTPGDGPTPPGGDQLQDHQGLVPTFHSSSRSASPAQPVAAPVFPYPFSANDLLPLVTGMAGSTASQMTPSLSPSRRTSQSSMALPSSFSRQSSMAPEKPAEEDGSKLPVVPEEVVDTAPKPDEVPSASSVTALSSMPTTSTPAADAAPRLERAQGAVRRALSEGAAEERESKAARRAFVPLVLGGRSIDVLMAEQDSCIHPLLRAVRQDDLCNHHLEEPDHGSWDGRWTLPSRGTWEVFEMGGVSPHEIYQTQTGAGKHKEMRWAHMDEETRQQFRLATDDQWSKWVDNNAIEVLNLQESKAIYQDLERKGELDRILKPRLVLTDKNASLRTPDCPLPLKASSRIVIPGYKDLANLQGELRRDAPTGSRLAQHLLFCIAGAHPDWKLRSADVRAAFLKGDPYIKRTLFIVGTDGSKGPSVPIPQGCVARVLKGVFGLADAPREWYLRLNRELQQEKWQRSMLDGALWYYWIDSTDGKNKELGGVIVGHVDDLLFTGTDAALASLLRLGDILGFGSVEEENFQWCGKRIFRDANAREIVINMSTYHQQLKTVTGATTP